MRYEWPGNVRALRHAVERAVILSREDFLNREDFQLESQFLSHKNYVPPEPESSEKANSATGDISGERDLPGEEDLNLERIEYRTILEALRKNRYVISKAAKDLGLTRAALYRRMEKYGI